MTRRRRRTAPRSSFHSIPSTRITNPFAPLEIGTPAQVEQIHAASLDILENIGIDFFDAEALSIWEQAGAKVDHQSRHVWMDRGLVMEQVAKAPEHFRLRGRNPAKDMLLGDNQINFLPGGGHAFVNDLTAANATVPGKTSPISSNCCRCATSFTAPAWPSLK